MNRIAGTPKASSTHSRLFGKAVNRKPTIVAAAPAQTSDQRQPWTGAPSSRPSSRALRIEAMPSANASASAAPAAWKACGQPSARIARIRPTVSRAWTTIISVEIIRLR